jgi:phosphoribosylglycinamide formyltransferase-1
LPTQGANVSEPLRVAVLASGRGSNFASLLQAARVGQLPISLVGVFSDRPSAPVLQRARDAGVPAHPVSPAGFVDRHAHELALFAAVDAVQPDLIVCAGYMRILGANALNGRSQRMINIHPSLLPRHRGLHTHQQALDAGDTEHGASVHFVTPQLDGGPVIAQVQIAVGADDDAASLAARLLPREHSLLRACVGLFAAGRLAMRDDRAWLDDMPLRTPLQLGADDQLQPGARA